MLREVRWLQTLEGESSALGASNIVEGLTARLGEAEAARAVESGIAEYVDEEE